jgi:exonuclease VII small subunit
MFNNKSKFNPEEDKFLAVKFHKKAIHNKFKSEQEGRQVYEDVDWINIKIPGDRTSEVSRKVREEDKERFEYQWNNYINKQESLANGTPVDVLPGISPAQAANLKAIKVETIEQLSNLHEKAIKNLFEGRELVKSAEKFLKGDGYTKELEKKIKELEKKINLLEEGNNEPTNNNTKRNKRNTTGRGTSNSSGE